MKLKWFSLGCLTSIALLIAIIVLGVRSATKMMQTEKAVAETNIKFDSWMTIQLNGPIKEFSEIKPDNIFNDVPTSVHSVCLKIDEASKDPRISGIYLRPQGVICGLASLNRIGESLENFKKSGKSIITYLDMATDRDYYLATFSTKIFLEPSASAGIALTGTGADMNFYGNLLKRIGIKVNVVHAGKYKGAGETYSRDRLSSPHKKNLTSLIDNIYREKLGKTAYNRDIEYNTLANIYESREELFISQKEALKYQLVDALQTEEEVKTKYSVSEKKSINYKDYNHKSESKFEKKIAVLYAQGTIMQASKYNRNALSSNKIKSQVDKILKDGSIKAVVLRIESPGGSALESEKIYNTLRRLKVPVYVSMANIAASGGYYISCAGKYVFADPMTITGSIGVVSMIPQADVLADNIGITSDGVKRGKFSGAFNIFKPVPEYMLQSFQKNSEDIYFEFKSRVAEGRNLELSYVEKVAQGQVWSGTQALENKLVNQTGTLKDAISFAANENGLKAFEVVYYPEQKTLLEIFFEENLNIENFTTAFRDFPFDELKKIREFGNLIKNEKNLILMPYKVQ